MSWRKSLDDLFDLLQSNLTVPPTSAYPPYFQIKVLPVGFLDCRFLLSYSDESVILVHNSITEDNQIAAIPTSTS